MPERQSLTEALRQSRRTHVFLDKEGRIDIMPASHRDARREDNIPIIIRLAWIAWQFVAWALRRYEARTRGRLPQWAFEDLAYFIGQGSPEVFIVRGSEVCLKQRPSDDVCWPGQLHGFGTVVYGSDNAFTDLFRRLQREIGRITTPDGEMIEVNVETMRVVGWHVTDRATRTRGPCLHLVLLLEVPEGTRVDGGTFFPLNKLPPNTIDHHVTMIGMVHAWLERNRAVAC